MDSFFLDPFTYIYIIGTCLADYRWGGGVVFFSKLKLFENLNLKKKWVRTPHHLFSKFNFKMPNSELITKWRVLLSCEEEKNYECEHQTSQQGTPLLFYFGKIKKRHHFPLSANHDLSNIKKGKKKRRLQVHITLNIRSATWTMFYKTSSNNQETFFCKALWL